MPKATILRREYTWQYTADQQVEEMVEVMFSTPAIPPRAVRLPLVDYRQATPEELSANPRYHYLPANEQAADRERRAIEVDISRVTSSPATTIEL